VAALAAGIDAASMARRCQHHSQRTRWVPPRMLSAGTPCAGLVARGTLRSEVL